MRAHMLFCAQNRLIALEVNILPTKVPKEGLEYGVINMIRRIG